MFSVKVTITSGLKITDSKSPVMMTSQINEYYDFFLPKEYRITLAIDRFDNTDIHIFDSNLVKNAFTRCRVPFRSF